MPKESWTPVYTDRSAENACSPEWRGRSLVISIQYSGGGEDTIRLATGLYLTNYKAEAQALKTTADHTEVSTPVSHSVVLLTDALSILQALQSNRNSGLSAALAALRRSHAVTLQWIPSHTTTCLTMRLLTVWHRRANILLLHCTLDGDACCPHEGGCPPQLLQVAIELIPQ